LTSISLDRLQTDLLEAFFVREHSFFLSGGAALVGFYFGHRETRDLDLFTVENELENGFRLINEIAHEMAATVEAIQTSPDFRRLLVKRGDEAVVVDLIREYVYQVTTEKPIINKIRVDPPEEIFANKLCTLLSRSEIRDLVDIRQLESAGFSLENALRAAEKKDSGLTAAQLSWVLDKIKIGDEARLPGDVPAPELRAYLLDLARRLKRLALPKS